MSSPGKLKFSVHDQNFYGVLVNDPSPAAALSS
jgi:hypothetical protein